MLQGIMGEGGALEAPFGCNLRTKMNCLEHLQQTYHPARSGTEKPDSPGSSDKGKGSIPLLELRDKCWLMGEAQRNGL